MNHSGHAFKENGKWRTAFKEIEGEIWHPKAKTDFLEMRIEKLIKSLKKAMKDTKKGFPNTYEWDEAYITIARALREDSDNIREINYKDGKVVVEKIENE